MGTIYNLGCYPVSLLHFVIETAFGSHAFAKRQLHGFGNISTEGSVHVRDASLTVRFDNGVLASLQSTDSYGNDSSFAILGDKGRIRFVTNPWLPIAGDNIIEIKTYGGSTEQVIVPADMDAFGYQVKKVEDYLSRGVKTAERPSPNVDQSVEIMGLLTEWEALIQSQHK
jgi:predicted dehydrogenase